MRDLQSKVSATLSIASAAINATATGASADLQGFNSALVLLTTGINTDGTHTPKLQESVDDSAWTDVAAGDLVGAFAVITTDTLQKVGYKGTQQYIRVVVTVSGATTGAVYGASILSGTPELSPAA